ncbi:helix-turn-helix domain-containing protein [Paraburkholderia pallida]|uniref:Helix-turn-helix domain-containing protein n=1 Tax=Paraburkholderia pallida TaxID=2547399 RepID=A0A4P7CWV6_9BURK|nr:helix-turn-helix domain-containing protein [Paraburkholderia pallida]
MDETRKGRQREIRQQDDAESKRPYRFRVGGGDQVRHGEPKLNDAAWLTKRLCHALRAGDSVTAAAMKWGFLHLGGFAQDYRFMFGERASDTVRRCRADQAKLSGTSSPSGIA